jgi:acyl-CoA synthetase (AMP-forming)/AMP-acid ligase II
MTGLVAAGARLIDAASGDVIAGQSLDDRIGAAADAYRSLPPGMAIIRARSDIRTVLCYLGCLAARRAVTMVDPALVSAGSLRLVNAYEPAAIVGLDRPDEPTPPAYWPINHPVLGFCWVRKEHPVRQPHADLALLLATSGSTGSPKLVRLSYGAVLDNANAIADALAIEAEDVAPTCLPLFYSYGLSVLNSHLARAATVLVMDSDVVSRRFWDAVERYAATSLSGVPASYQILDRMRWTPHRNPSVRVLTQAGGRLDPDLIAAFHARMTAVGGRFHVMWGQTEAAPRMSVLPSESLPGKLGSVGPALPGGRLSIRLESGAETTEPRIAGEVVYRGRNVMLGYASSAADLVRGDVLGGVLRTGDLGYLDEDGYLWLTGRINRIGKVAGIRFNLDDIEKMADGLCPVSAVEMNDRIVVFGEGLDDTGRLILLQRLTEGLRINRGALDVRAVERLPALSNGKVDYRSLEVLADGGSC